MDIMLDIETLAVTPDATILSIAAVEFDPFQQYEAMGVDLHDLRTFNVKVDIDSQDRFIDPKTLEWWGTQPAHMIEQTFDEKGRIPLPEALERLKKFVWNKGKIWCQGTSFDIPILENAYRQASIPVPWQYWQARDSRTILDLPCKGLAPATHDALEDCYRQLCGVQNVLYAYNVTRFVKN
jgi:hypothetical protein